MCCRLADTHWASATQQPALCPAGSKIDGCSCVYLSDVNSDHGQPTSQRICCAMFESYRKKNNRQQPCWHESNGTFVLCTENWTYILQTRSVYDQCPTWMYIPEIVHWYLQHDSMVIWTSTFSVFSHVFTSTTCVQPLILTTYTRENHSHVYINYIMY